MSASERGHNDLVDCLLDYVDAYAGHKGNYGD